MKSQEEIKVDIRNLRGQLADLDDPSCVYTDYSSVATQLRQRIAKAQTQLAQNCPVAHAKDVACPRCRI